MGLESNLRKSAEKKGLSGEDEKEYVGGTIGNMRKKGRLPPPKKKAASEKKPAGEKRPKKPAGEKRPKKLSEKQQDARQKAAEAQSKKVAQEYQAKRREEAQGLITRIQSAPRPKLKGSEKQIAWATEIRKAYVHKVRAQVGSSAPERYSPFQMETLEQYDKEFSQPTDYWIRHRFGLGLSEYKPSQK